MITHPTPTGWQIIYQRAHALLAAEIALHWRADQRPQRWIDTLAAIAQHDDGGQEWEGKNLLTPAGAPKPFEIGGKPDTSKPAQAITHAHYQSQYVALLQSMHVCALYKDFADDDDTMAAFAREQEAAQATWRKALGMTQAEAGAAYRLLYLCDAFSLVLCQRHLPTDGRDIEIGQGPDGTPYHARRLPENGGADPRAGGDLIILTVTPWAFEEDSFEIGVEATTVDGLTFEDDAAFVAALERGRVDRLVWRLERQGGQA